MPPWNEIMLATLERHQHELAQRKTLMLKEAIDAIASMADGASDPVALKEYKLIGDRTLRLNPDGSHAIEDNPPNVREHEVFSLTDLMAMAKLRNADTVWHSNQMVQLRFDDKYRQDHAVMPLETAKSLALLQSLPKSYDQGQLVRILKTVLAGKVPADLITTIRTVNFTKMEETRSTVDATRDGLGRTVERAVTGAGKIPETFPVMTQAFVNAIPDLNEEVIVTLDVDLEQKRFVLDIQGDSLLAFEDLAHAELRKRIDQLLGDVKYQVSGIFHGNP